METLFLAIGWGLPALFFGAGQLLLLALLAWPDNDSKKYIALMSFGVLGINYFLWSHFPFEISIKVL